MIPSVSRSLLVPTTLYGLALPPSPDVAQVARPPASLAGPGISGVPIRSWRSHLPGVPYGVVTGVPPLGDQSLDLGVCEE